MRTKQVDTLPARYFRIKPVFFCNLAQYDKFIGGNFAARYARNYRISNAFLNICQETIITILDGILHYDHVVPQARENTCNGRFAHLATVAFTKMIQRQVITLHFIYLNQVVKFLSRIIKMLAYYILDIL